MGQRHFTAHTPASDASFPPKRRRQRRLWRGSRGPRPLGRSVCALLCASPPSAGHPRPLGLCEPRRAATVRGGERVSVPFLHGVRPGILCAGPVRASRSSAHAEPRGPPASPQSCRGPQAESASSCPGGAVGIPRRVRAALNRSAQKRAGVPRSDARPASPAAMPGRK